MNNQDRHYPTSRVTKDGIDINIAPNGVVTFEKKIGEEVDGIDVPASVIFFVKNLLVATRKKANYIREEDKDE